MADFDDPYATGSAPAGHGFRRSKTVDETSNPQRRSSFMPPARSSFAEALHRRDDRFSIFSFNPNSARDQQSEDGFWNMGRTASSPDAPFSAATLPVILALLPAVGGLCFEGGAAFFTDIILLGLGAIVLRASVTQPWCWHSIAQEIRVAKEVANDMPAFEGDSDLELSTSASATTALEDVPEERGDKSSTGETQTSDDLASEKRWKEEREAVAQSLRWHEKFALGWCCLFPVLAAFLLHSIRGQLTPRPEGLLSNCNLLIFVGAAELKPVTHFIKMLHNTTFRKQQIVANNPYEQREQSEQDLNALHEKINELETRLSDREAASTNDVEQEQKTKRSVEMLVMRNYRDKVQPRVEFVTCALRRYEKKLSNIINRIDIKLEYLDQRSSHAVALATAVARQKTTQGDAISWALKQTSATSLLPFQAAITVLTFSFTTLASLMERGSKSSPEKTRKRGRRAPGSSGAVSNRIPTRMSKK